MTDVIWGTSKKPISSRRLADIIEENFHNQGVLYVGYPILSGTEGVNSVDALWVSPQHGIVIFHLVEGVDSTGFQHIQDDYANKLETRLRAHSDLMKGRNLLASPVVVTFAPVTDIQTEDPDYRIASDDISLIRMLNQVTWEHPSLFERAHSVIQSISTIRSGRRKRINKKTHSHGAILKNLEDSIANLDSQQSRAVIETVDGVQRIRGLAGSGKTIILALKAAYLHVQHPEWKIAVTFNTRSLKHQFKKLIQTFVFEQTLDQPDWDQIQVINAWGASGGEERTGIYYQYCLANGIEFFDFQQAKRRFSSTEAFKGVVELALSGKNPSKPIFDAILVDEAQDFDANFLRLCYQSLNKEKRLVYAYDELQSLTDSSLPPVDELFGLDESGKPNVVFGQPIRGQPSQDIVLEKCYRNSGPVLATAHALGFGIYRDVDPITKTGLIQMFDRAELWNEVGYKVKSGSLEDGAAVVLARTADSSPSFLEAPKELDPLIEFLEFQSPTDQAAWLSEQIMKNISVDELKHDDIIVINPDPLTTVKAVATARKMLFDIGVQSHVAGVDTSSDVFFNNEEDSVAFTGIFRAKGNEAGMVYVINAQDCYGGKYNVGRVRNQLFTAITRSKAWVKVLGIGPDMIRLRDEYRRVVDKNYELSFQYPTIEVRKKLKVVNRDRSILEQQNIKGASSNLSQLVTDIKAGKVSIDDLPLEDIELLRNLLSEKGN